MYSTHNEGKSVVAKRFTRTLKNKIYKHMTAVSKNVYIDKLDDIINEYNNAYHRTIKMKPIEVKDNIYNDYIKEVNDKDPKFKIGDHVRISKHKNIFAKGYAPNCSEVVLMIPMVKKLLEHFMKKNYKKQINKDLGYKKPLKEKETNYTSNGKDMIIHLIAGLIKKT